EGIVLESEGVDQSAAGAEFLQTNPLAIQLEKDQAMLDEIEINMLRIMAERGTTTGVAWDVPPFAQTREAVPHPNMARRLSGGSSDEAVVDEHDDDDDLKEDNDQQHNNNKRLGLPQHSQHLPRKDSDRAGALMLDAATLLTQEKLQELEQRPHDSCTSGEVFYDAGRKTKKKDNFGAALEEKISDMQKKHEEETKRLKAALDSEASALRTLRLAHEEVKDSNQLFRRVNAEQKQLLDSQRQELDKLKYENVNVQDKTELIRNLQEKEREIKEELLRSKEECDFLSQELNVAE
ncbi:unnamed protein product, partial [Amoebophrya sp. A120]